MKAKIKAAKTGQGKQGAPDLGPRVDKTERAM